MSEPKRYMVHRTVQVPCGCVQDELIDCESSNPRCETFVPYADYARLKAEVERLTKERDKALTDFWYIHEGYFRLQAEVNRLTAFTTRTIIPNEELQAQVERLTKAGDAMAAHIERNDELCYIVLPDGDIRISEWNAAKEGKPRA